MPIRPEMRHLYPPPREWREIRARILARAGDACECLGECGREHDGGTAVEADSRCRAPNRISVHRYEYDRPAHPVGWIDTWDTEPDSGADLEACGATLRDRKIVRVVLTIAHLDHDPRNNDPANLRALCQRCHLRHDAAEHARTRAARRASEPTRERDLLAHLEGWW